MKKIISFRPGVIGNNTAFECQAMIYKYLQTNYGYKFTIVKSEDDVYHDPEFEIISIPKRLWRPIPNISLFSLPVFISSTILKSVFLQADILLTVDPTVYPQGLLAINSARRLGIPVWFDSSLTIMGTGRGVEWKLVRPLMLKALYRTTGIIITVPKCIERFQDLRLFDEVTAPKFTVMGHPVDTGKFKPIPKKSEQDDILRILVVSRLVPEKGLFYILEAITPILQDNTNIILQILGNGPMKKLLEKEICQRDLQEKIKFLEPVQHGELPQILGTGDIFVNHMVPSSRSEEAFGAVNIEAMSCSLPSVISRVGGIPYVLREDNIAVLVEPRNIVETRDALLKLIRNKDIRDTMGEKARRYVKKHYSLPLVAEKYHSMLQTGLQKT